MIDELYDRSYRGGRAQLNQSLISGIGSVSRAVMSAFDTLNRIQYRAPWTPRAKRVRSH